MFIWVVVVMSLDFLNLYALANCLDYINHFPQMKSGNKTAEDLSNTAVQPSTSNPSAPNQPRIKNTVCNLV